MRVLGTVFFVLAFMGVYAGEINGIVKDEKGNILPFSTITIKVKKIGTTANDRGFFKLSLPPGNYTVICQHIGYSRQEISVIVGAESQSIEFILREQEVSLQEVVVKAGENPADEIIRNAIKNRKTFLIENEIYQCDVYVKGVLRLRDYPKKFFGQDVDLEDGDTSKQKPL